MNQKPFSESSEENKYPIITILKTEFKNKKNILEIGSGTGQHALFFAEQLPYLCWQPSDRKENLPGINAWIADSTALNILPPIELDVNLQQWPSKFFDGVFSANTAHIMAWPEVEKMLDGISNVLIEQGHFCLYGPFNFNNKYTSESNARFDTWLKNQNPNRGIRNFEDLNFLANSLGLSFVANYEMPANNRILVWQKKSR